MSNDVNEGRVFDILMRTRAGSINTTDATREEVAACVDAGLLEWTLSEGLRYLMTAAVHVSYRDKVLDFDALPKLHDVALTPLGRERIRARLGFDY